MEGLRDPLWIRGGSAGEIGHTVMNHYHTAILLVVSHNVDIPLAISFGPKESFELYNRLYTFFRTDLNIDLPQFILESALNSIDTVQKALVRS
jgi:hypothetical protein